MPPDPVTPLDQLLISLTNAMQGTTLVLDATTLDATSASALLDLFSELHITSFTLDDVRAVCGHRRGTAGQRPPAGRHADSYLL